MSDSKRVARRSALGGLATFPLVALVSSPPLIALSGVVTGGCGRAPETPLAHLHGRDWVHGAYALYAQRYADVQVKAESNAQDSYRVLAQKGVGALDGLQQREVPFFVRVADDERSFSIARTVPERLTFTAEMDEAARRRAQETWKSARDHIHTDYEQIRRLDWALTRLLIQLQRIRNAIEEGRVEQYRLVEQRLQLAKEPKNLPYELPYGVTPKEYDEILLLLLERLEDDRERLLLIEADIIAVGLTTRTTDANSATLSASIRKVLLAVVEDGAIPPRAATFPVDASERARLLESGRALASAVEKSDAFHRWKVEEQEKRLAAFGTFLGVLDTMTGLPTSQVYRTIMSLWKGDRDYLEYMTAIVALMPRGSALANTIREVIEYTARARQIAGVVAVTVSSLRNASSQALVEELRARVTSKVSQTAILNTASRFALERATRQLSFYKDLEEVATVRDLLAETDLMKGLVPAIPTMP